MRVSQRTMYNNYINNMNSTLSAYMESNMQAASEKQVNKPSDDPAGMARILMYRSSIADISQFQRNLSTARGWLSLADSTLSDGNDGASNLLTQIKGLAEQASTGTLSEENRLQIAEELRRKFGSLLNLSNARYEGKSIFAGQEYTNSAFQMTNAADCGSADFQADLQTASTANPPDWIRFSSLFEKSAAIRFTAAGTTGVDNLDYEYTTDGGKTWSTGTMTAAAREVDLGGTIMTIPDGVRIPAFDEANTKDTQIIVRQSAMYNGADNDMVPQIVRRGFPGAPLSVSTSGKFAGDIQLRMDTAVTDWSVAGQDFSYSYSTDGGLTWVQRQGSTTDPRLTVPGGFVQIGGAAGSNAGDAMTIKPQRTSLDMQAELDFMAMANNVGKDIFGGQYMTLNASGQYVQRTAFGGGPQNVFETVGKLLGALETNNQDTIQEQLANLADAQVHVTSQAARVGARRNMLDVAEESLITSKDSQIEAKSNIEDIDLTTLLTKLAQQQLAYSTVLKSSSMIMQMNLTQYI